MLDPNFSVNGEEFEAYSQRRWGSSGWTLQLKEQGRKDGATFQNWKWWPNTLKAHQLVHFASNHGVDTSTSNAALFEALYEEGENLSLIDTLVGVGVNKLGLPRSELTDYISKDEGAQIVKRDFQRGKQSYQISGVPFFIVRNPNSEDPPYGISGAQSSRKFLEIFDELSDP